mgnify:CR=1 FL=1
MSDQLRETEGLYRTVPFVATAEKQDGGWHPTYKLASGMGERPAGELQESAEAALVEATIAAVQMVRLIFDDRPEPDTVNIQETSIHDAVQERLDALEEA